MSGRKTASPALITSRDPPLTQPFYRDFQAFISLGLSPFINGDLKQLKSSDSCVTTLLLKELNAISCLRSCRFVTTLVTNRSTCKKTEVDAKGNCVITADLAKLLADHHHDPSFNYLS